MKYYAKQQRKARGKRVRAKDEGKQKPHKSIKSTRKRKILLKVNRKSRKHGGVE